MSKAFDIIKKVARESLTEGTRIVHKEKNSKGQVIGTVYYNSEYQEYNAIMKGEKKGEDGYFTDDKEDAIGTLKLMLKQTGKLSESAEQLDEHAYIGTSSFSGSGGSTVAKLNDASRMGKTALNVKGDEMKGTLVIAPQMIASKNGSAVEVRYYNDFQEEVGILVLAPEAKKLLKKFL